MKSREKNWRESRSRETEVGEKIAVTTKYIQYYALSICGKQSGDKVKIF